MRHLFFFEFVDKPRKLKFTVRLWKAELVAYVRKLQRFSYLGESTKGVRWIALYWDWVG